MLITSFLNNLAELSIIFLRSTYFFTNLKLFGFKPSKSSVTKTCPSQYAEDPIPIVGTFTELVIFFANDFSTHSNTIEKTPEDESTLASFKILFLSVLFFPLNTQEDPNGK